jgi:hypothetical protein
MENYIYEIEVCQGSSFDLQSAVSFAFDNWEAAQNFIKLSLDNALIVQVYSSRKNAG